LVAIFQPKGVARADDENALKQCVNEDAWNACEDVDELLRCQDQVSRLTPRTRQLFACACFHEVGVQRLADSDMPLRIANLSRQATGSRVRHPKRANATVQKRTRRTLPAGLSLLTSAPAGIIMELDDLAAVKSR
jgi:hypothetical protein